MSSAKGVIKVGSAARLKTEAGKTLATIAGACLSPSSAAEGILAATQRCAALFHCLGKRREGSTEVLAAVAPLASVVSLAKMTVRRRRGLVVSPALQADIRACLAWQAKKCRGHLLGEALQDTDGDPVKMAAMEATVRSRVSPTITVRRNAPPHPARADASSTATPPPSAAGSSSNNSSNNNSSSSGRSASSAKLVSFTRAARGVGPVSRFAPRSSGTVFVAARRPAVAVDPRACQLVGSGAIHRRC